MQFTSSVGFSTNETPLTLEWAEENFELLCRGDYERPFLINKQADCYLIWNMDEDRIFWKLYLHYAVFDVEYIEELEWICKSFGVKIKKDEEMTLIAPMNIEAKTLITQELIKKKYAPTLKKGTLSMTIGTVEYMIDTELKLWVTFEAKFEEDESKIYIDCSGCECKLEVKYIEQIEWVINKLKSIKSWITN